MTQVIYFVILTEQFLRYNIVMFILGKILFLLMLGTVSERSFSQDERFYRSLFDEAVLKEPKNIFHYKVLVDSPKYMIDINRDGKKDIVQTVKKDGVDFIKIIDAFGKEILFEKLDPKGKQSRIFKVQYRAMSPSLDVLIVHYYEGYNQAAFFEGSARLYFITIENQNMNKIHFKKGPYFWSEVQKIEDIYWRKKLSVNTLDYNKDGVKEISVSYNKSSYIYFYLTKGVWKKI